MRLVFVGMGLIALEFADCALAQGHEIVGAVDVDPVKVGRDAGEVLGREAFGVEVVPSVSQVTSSADVALVATGSTLRAAGEQLHACIQHGLNAVSTCEELVYPWRTQPELAQRIDDEARREGVTVVGAGINPGFAMDALALVISAPCSTVRSVHIRRVLDAGTRRASFRHKVGVGLTDTEFQARVASGAMGHVGLAESAWMISDRLGLGGEHLEQEIEPVLDGTGIVAGLHQTASLHGTGEVVHLEMTMAVGVSEPVDVIELEADPPVRMTIAGGLPGDAGTAGVVVNAARTAAGAAPGLLTIDQLPMVYAAPPGSRAGNHDPPGTHEP